MFFFFAAFQSPDWRVGCLFLIVLTSKDTDGRSRCVSHGSFARSHFSLCRKRFHQPSHLSLQHLQYVVVSSKKILFYNDEQDKEQSNPSMVLDIE